MARSIYCSKCKQEKEPGRDNESYCKTCKSIQEKATRLKKRLAKGLPEYGTGRSLNCSSCNKIKEHRERTYCNECNNAKERERWANQNSTKYNKREITLICECGKEKESTRKVYCKECLLKRKKESAKIAARERRKIHGSKVERSIYCSNCKEVKEHQERGYCLSCERERYKQRNKPDCVTCGAMKENPRDSYCNECKREKARAKSIAEGRRPQNNAGMGRKTTCSNCGREKEKSQLNEGYCINCKIFRKQQIRPFRTEEQKFKDKVRKITWKAIEAGILIRKPCEVCNTEIDVQAHHDDYYKPLDVRWLCRKHHREHHLNEKIKD
jgi:hypothetical protein